MCFCCCGALQQGTLTWLTNSSAQVATYDRTGGGNEYIVEINTNGTAASGTITGPTGTWTDVTPVGSPGGTSHVAPPSFSLAAYDFAIFKKGTTSAPGAPSSLAATAGNAQVALTWSAGSGATSYNLYRSTTAGGEGTTPVQTGITGTSYTNTGLTNGTTYYFKVAAVNSAGTSGMSNEASAQPVAATGGSLSGAVTPITTAQAFNLTTQGSTDWAAYGNAGGCDHSSAGGSQISNVSVAGGGALSAFNSAFLGLTWTNGTPDASATNETNGYYNSGGVNDGFQLTVPAGTSSQKAIVYVGGWNTGGTLTATLSDGSAAAYTNSSQSSTGSYYAYYTLTYNAGSAGKTLTIKWTQASGTGNVTIYGVALQPASVSVPSAPTGLAVTAGNAQNTLSWTASSGATSYNIYRGTTAGGEGGTAIANVSGTTYTNTGLTNGTAYYYKVAAVNSAGTSGMSNEASGTPTAPPAGSLTGTVTAVTTAQAFNLTTQGTTDWAAYGYGASNFEHSSAGGSKISNASVSGGGAMTSFASSFLGSTWTNGSPDASVTNETNGFYNNGGVNDGFQLTVPASTTVQHVTVYVGGWSTGGKLTATLSDGSAAAYTDTSQSNLGNSYYAHYDLTYNAASAGQTLTIKWVENTGTGNVTLYAATLH